MKPKDEKDPITEKPVQPRLIVGGDQEHRASIDHAAGNHALSAVQRSPSNVEYAGLRHRLAAVVIDEITLVSLQVLLALLLLLFCYVLHHFFPTQAQTLLPNWESRAGADRVMNFCISSSLCTYCLIPWLYVAFFESSPAQATPGKRILNLKVTSMSGERLSFVRASLKLAMQALLLLLLVPIPAEVLNFFCRSLGFQKAAVMLSIAVSATFFCFMLLNRRRQTLFDKLSGRLVVLDKDAAPEARSSSARFIAATVATAIIGWGLVLFCNIKPDEMVISHPPSSGWVKNMSGEIVTAATEIKEGQTIQPQDLKQARIDSYRTPLYAIQAIPVVSGCTAHKAIHAGDIICYGDLNEYYFVGRRPVSHVQPVKHESP